MAVRGHRGKQAALPALPDDILPNVLQFVDLQQRLGSCARVSHLWQAAAAAGTVDIHCTLKQQQDPLAPLRSWLSNYGAKHVHSIDLSFSWGANILLPLQQLQQLRSLSLAGEYGNRALLQCWEGQHVGSSSSSSTTVAINNKQAIQSATQRSDEGNFKSHGKEFNPFEYVSSTLTSLKLRDIEVQGFPAGWHCLEALTAMQHLYLRQTQYIRTTDDLADTLPHLTSLTQLRLEWKLEDKLRAVLGQLSFLQDLTLWGLDIPQDSSTPLSLPCSLTRLELVLSQQLNSSSIPGLAALTALQHLQLKNITQLDASLLSGMTQLTQLELEMDSSKFKASCMEKMMRALRQMQQLQHLVLDFVDRSYSQKSAPAVSWHQCSALTSSSHLTHLELKGLQLPYDSGSRLFGKRLPHLKAFKVDASCSTFYRSVDNTLPKPFGRDNDIWSLVNNCPSMCKLDFAGAVREGVDLGGLRFLTGLTSLVVGGHCVNDACAARMAQLSLLNSLTVLNAAPESATEADYAGRGSRRRNRRGGGTGRPDFGHGGVCGYFTMEGLRSLMQLTSLNTFAISAGTCLSAQSRYSSSYDDDSLMIFRSPVSICQPQVFKGTAIACNRLST
jgi:hypothetical protein